MTREKAIEVVKEAMPTLWKETKDAIQTLIPEFAESEDERIRKTLIHIVKGACDKYGIKYMGDEISEEKLLAYLEKQKEQKPAEWSKEEQTIIEGACNALEIHGHSKLADNLKSLRPQPKQEWSEEDEKMLEVISYKISQHQGNDERSLFSPDEAEFISGMEDKLKSFRPSWKPSKEQMEALNTLLCTGDFSYVGQHSQIQGLYNDLKKL